MNQDDAQTIADYLMAREVWNQRCSCKFAGFNQGECAQELEGAHFSRCHATCWMFTADTFSPDQKTEPAYADFYR
jgi:hypothetical protein